MTQTKLAVWGFLGACLVGFLLFAAPSFAREPTEPTRPSMLSKTLETYVEENHARSVAAALVTPEGVVEASAGNQRPSGDSRFEVGSVTKVFTSMLLASLVQDGTVTLEATVAELAPAGVDLDEQVASITLRELSTHTSGLPRLGLGALIRAMMHPQNPYAGSTNSDIYAELERLDADDLGTRGNFAYSNLGAAVLGTSLERAAGKPYEALVEERILAPLRMDDSGFNAPGEPTTVGGHRSNLLPTSDWDLGSYVPAGALVSSRDDMVRFVQTGLTGDFEPLQMTMKVHHDGGDDDRSLGLGWIIDDSGDERLIWHNGQTGGYYSFVGLLPESGRAIVFLSDTSHPTDLPRRLLANDEPVEVEPVDKSWVWGALTFGSLLLAPFGLASFLYKTRRRRQNEDGRKKRPPSRLDVINNGLSGAVYLTIVWKLGTWHWVPMELWYLSAAATAALLVWAALASRGLGWMPRAKLWRQVLLGLGVFFNLIGVYWTGFLL